MGLSSGRPSTGRARRGRSEPSIAAYLWFEVKTGDKFTMRQLRDALGEHDPNADEHLNRRLRTLRQRGWELPSYKDRPGLKPDEYLLVKKGDRLRLGEGKRPPAISQRARRIVLDRDGNRCVICGIGAGEPYPEDGKPARMTIGHRTAGARLLNATPAVTSPHKTPSQTPTTWPRSWRSSRRSAPRRRPGFTTGWPLV